MHASAASQRLTRMRSFPWRGEVLTVHLVRFTTTLWGAVTVVLTTPGVFAYACQIHPVMTGEIAVRGPDGAVPTSAPAATPTTAVVPVRIALVCGVFGTWSSQLAML